MIILQTNPEQHFSTFLMDHLQPISLRDHWDISLRTEYYIQPLINSIKLITDLGEAEHTGDWDPLIIIKLKTGQTIETDPGYYIMEIQNSDLLLEDAPGNGDQEDEDISYHIIPITDIRSIEIQRQ